jgi:hypothetical protein
MYRLYTCNEHVNNFKGLGGERFLFAGQGGAPIRVLNRVRPLQLFVVKVARLG